MCSLKIYKNIFLNQISYLIIFFCLLAISGCATMLTGATYVAFHKGREIEIPKEKLQPNINEVSKFIKTKEKSSGYDLTSESGDNETINLVFKNNRGKEFWIHEIAIGEYSDSSSKVNKYGILVNSQSTSGDTIGAGVDAGNLYDEIKLFVDKLPEKNISPSISSTIETMVPSGPEINIDKYFKYTSGKKKSFKSVYVNIKDGKRVEMIANMTFLEPRLFNNKQVIPVKTEINGNISLMFRSEEKDSLLYIGRQTKNMTSPEEINPPKIIIKKPLQLGSSWDSPDKTVLSDEKLDFLKKSTVVSVNDIILTPLGEFKDCIRIVSSGTVNLKDGNKYYIKSTSWYAPNVGEVKSNYEENGKSGGVKFESEIISQ